MPARFISMIGRPLAWLGLAIVTTSGAAEPAAAKPNVLFIAVDDLKPAIGCYGDRLAKTPNIDRLAARGTVFERVYCMQAVCAPSRNALLTGLRPETLRIYDLGTNFRRRAPDVVTLPQHFKARGYETHGLGKIFHVGHGNHEDPASWSVPHFQAKTVQYVLPENKAQITREEALFANRAGNTNQLPKGAAYEQADVPDEEYADGRIAAEAIKRLQGFKASGEPFFLAVGFLKPHLPFCAPKKCWDLHDPAKLPMPLRGTPPDGAPEFAPQRGGELRNYAGIPSQGPIPEELTRTLIHGYYAAASYMDAQLGRVLDELDRLDLAENTIVVLWGDHGWHLGDHGIWCKHTDYEQATRAPLIVAAPGKKAGQHTRALAEFVDVYPTLCDLAGIPRPAHLQGDSLVPLLDDPQATGKPAAFQVYPRQSPPTGRMLGHAVRTERWRYVEWRKADESVAARELYDLRDDPGETVNLAARPEHAAVVAEHGKLLAARLAVAAPDGLKLQDPANAPAAKPAADPQGDSRPPAKQPHIILILTDDMGIGDLGCYGGKLAATPHIDGLANQGTRFTQYYSAAPICSPSRAGVLTGMFPARWRLTSFLQTRAGNRGCQQADFLDPLAPSIPRRLKRAGYATAHFGKWHLGGGRDVTDAPKLAAYGYDENASTWESPEPHPDITATNWIWSDQDKVKRWDRTAFFVDKTLDFLRRNKDQPCFVNLWPDDVHTPWVPAPDALKGDTQGNLRPVLVEFDRQIGRLMDGLRELGIERDTLVLFTSDNGALPTFAGARSGGLRASKLSLYEGGIRMPLIAHWPGHIPAGRVDETTVLSAVDWFPTLAALSGAGLPHNVALDGEDMTAALLGKPVVRRKPLYWEYGRNDEFFRYPPVARNRSPGIAVREASWKLLVNADGSRTELYDVVADPGETANVAAEKPELAGRLRESALAWWKSLPAAARQPAEQPAPAPQATGPMARPQRPNIVVFLTDDQSQADSSAYGSRDLRTPNMQRLAAAGLTFTRAYVASSSCAPSRAALLTALMPARNGAEANHSRPRDEIRKLPAYLQELGYEVVMFGKVAHYGHGKSYGFDRAELEGFHDHRGIAAAVELLAARDVKKARPLCLFVGTNWPHRPWPEDAGGYEAAAVTVPATHVDTEVTRKYRARYYHAVAKADEDLGVIYDAALKHLGKETLFVFSSDHGAQWPLGKWNCYEDGLRVPLIVSWPGVVQPAAKTDAMVSWIDILPTLVEAAGGQPPKSGMQPGQIDGRSFLAVLRGERQEHRNQIFGTHSGDREMNVYPIRSLREGSWKYIWNLHPEFQHTTHVDRAQAEDEVGYFRSWERAAEAGDKHAAAVIDRYRRRPRAELYDLDADPLEQHNLATEPAHARRVQAMHAKLAAWMEEQGDQRTVFNKPVLLTE